MYDLISCIAFRIESAFSDIDRADAAQPFCFSLFAAVKRHDEDIEETARFLRRDPALCAQLLKVANSEYYARGTAVKTVSQAVANLGLDALKRLVTAIELIGLFHKNEKVFWFDERAFWKSSIAGAMVCRELATRLRLKDTETPFICGLLRDFGAIVLRRYFPDVFKSIIQVCEDLKNSFSSACSFVCALDHRYIAYLQFLRWNIKTDILSAFNIPSQTDPGNTLLSKIVAQAAYTLQINHYAQWDRYAKHEEIKTDVFAFEPKELDEKVQDIFNEADELVGVILV